MIVPLYKSKREKIEYKNYKDISLSMVEKIYAGILVDGVHSNQVLIDDEQGGFREGRAFVHQIFILNQIDDKAL